MPLYEYQCDKCGAVFEVIEKFSDKPLTVHENCGGNVERLLSAPALQFKGSGWYVNDYAKSGSPPSNGESKKKDASETSSTKEASGAKSDSKGAAKSSDNSASSTTSTSTSDKK